MYTLGKTFSIVVLSAFLSLASAQSDWPSSLTIGTASVGGTYFIYGGGWANLIQEQLGVPTSVEVTGGPAQNMLLIQNGDIELGMITMGPAFEGWSGDGPWTGGRQLQDSRALFPMYNTPFHVIALQSTGIETISQLEGRSVGVGPAGGTTATFAPRFLETLGVNANIRQAGASDLASQLLDGQIDAFVFAAGLPIAAFSEIEAQRNANIFSFNEEERAVLLESFVFLNEDMIPADIYQSLDEDFSTVGMYNFAIGHRDLPEDFVYEMVKAVFENQQFLIDTHASAVDTVPENLNRNGFLWLHPGAVRFYQEIGMDVPAALIPPEFAGN